MVRAINKHGREAYFSERVWGMMPKDKNGWVEFSQQGEVLVPQQIIEFQQKKKEAVVVDTKDETPIEATPVEQPPITKVDIPKKPLPKKPVNRTKK